MTDQQKECRFEGYAIVELMGRSVIAGYVSEQVIAGAAMLRVDVPAVGDQPAYSKFVGGGAIYGITPTTQDIAQRAAERLRVRPVSEWTLPDSSLRPALVDSFAGDEDDEDDEDDARSSKTEYGW